MRNVTRSHDINVILTDEYPGIDAKEVKRFQKTTYKIVVTAVDV